MAGLIAQGRRPSLVSSSPESTRRLRLVQAARRRSSSAAGAGRRTPPAPPQSQHGIGTWCLRHTENLAPTAKTGGRARCHPGPWKRRTAPSGPPNSADVPASPEPVGMATHSSPSAIKWAALARGCPCPAGQPPQGARPGLRSCRRAAPCSALTVTAAGEYPAPPETDGRSMAALKGEVEAPTATPGGSPADRSRATGPIGSARARR